MLHRPLYQSSRHSLLMMEGGGCNILITNPRDIPDS